MHDYARPLKWQNHCTELFSNNMHHHESPPHFSELNLSVTFFFIRMVVKITIRILKRWNIFNSSSVRHVHPYLLRNCRRLLQKVTRSAASFYCYVQGSVESSVIWFNAWLRKILGIADRLQMQIYKAKFKVILYTVFFASVLAN